MDVKLLGDTYLQLQPELCDIVAAVQSVPAEERPGTAHIDHASALAQYVFYVSLMRRWLPQPGASILDWGGQHGQVTRLLSRFYPNTVCYCLENDAYDGLYGLAKWHSRLQIKNVIRSSDPLRLKVSDGSFDAVVSSGVLEHVAECGVKEYDILAEIRRSLKPNGLFFIWNLPRQFGREYLYPLIHRHYHERRYRKREIQRSLHESGFSVLYLRCHELLPLSALKRLEGKISPERLIRYDYGIAEVFGFLAQNFTIVAQRR